LTARLAVPDLLDRLMLISFDMYQRIAPREGGRHPDQYRRYRRGRP
jgi:hypothetical protein